MEKKHENRRGNFCSMLLIMHGKHSYSAISNYHLTIKKLVCMHFYSPLDFGGLAARLQCLVGFSQK